MKKPQIAIVLLLLLFAAIITGCNKEQEPQTSNDWYVVQNCLEAREAISRIIKFRQQLDSFRVKPSMKTAETVSLDDAAWNIENLFNITYAMPDELFSEMAFFEFSLYLPLDTAGRVALTDLFDVYDQAVSEARMAYANDGFVNKGFAFMLVDIGESHGNTVRLDFKGKSGERTGFPNWDPHDSIMYGGPFDATDYWQYKAPLGKCDDPNSGSGADKELQWRLQQYLATRFEAPAPGYRAVYLNRIVVDFNGRTAPTYAFHRTNTEAECIDFNNMNYYFWREKLYITDVLPNTLNGTVYGYVPTLVTIEGNELSVGENGEPACITHCNEVIYTQRVVASVDDVGETQDLLDN